MSNQSDLQLLLLHHGLKSTPRRIRVLAVLADNAESLDAVHIGSSIRKSGTPIDQVTVYRILEALFARGVIDRVELGEGKYRYEFATRKHHHLVCERCGRIEDIRDCPVDAMEANILSQQQFQVTRHSLEFFGFCRTCRDGSEL